jgi:DMSO/TMAO reductase YedYZ heme-binding membrane subunit
MRSTVRIRFWLEAGLASLCGFLAVLTGFWRDWVEAITGFSPDRHSGSLEWAIVAVLLLACVLAGQAARSEWRRPRAAFAARR